MYNCIEGTGHCEGGWNFRKFWLFSFFRWLSDCARFLRLAPTHNMKIRLLDFPDQQIGFDHLTSMGVLYWKINMDKWVDEVGAICKERGYKNRDEVFISLGDVKPESQVFTADTKIILTKEKPNLNAMLDKFFEEHLHYDEEIRFILDGQGRFDIRDKEDRWVGCTVEKGDLIIVVSGRIKNAVK